MARSENSSSSSRQQNVEGILSRLGIQAESSGVQNSGAWAGSWLETSGEVIPSIDPTTGEVLATVRACTVEEYQQVVEVAHQAFLDWRQWPAPRRGEVVRALGDALRDHKDDLGALITLEAGKVVSEGLGEVQEMIDMADLAVGMSRQLYGKTMHSERPQHRMYEQWHPLGVVGIITAFNFPMAVWAWNAMVAAVCGDANLWKPSEKTPLSALAISRIAAKVLKDHEAPPIFTLAVGDRHAVGVPMTEDHRIPLVSATGSVTMGRAVGQAVAQRLGRSLLELGGNNGIIVTPDADLDLTLMAVLFGAVGTAGQRCTSTRRLFLHESIAADMKQRLVDAYGSIRIGDPLDDGILMGPLMDQGAVDDMMAALKAVESQGGRVLTGGGTVDREGFFVEPTLVEATTEMPITCDETFAPILYIFEYEDLEDVIDRHNAVPQGLSSAIFTLDVRAAEQFLAATGSDCGIANVNIGTSGAEIGGAFGGEKETGGGREAGSDSWKIYMRRQTSTINWGTELPLAQGVTFDV